MLDHVEGLESRVQSLTERILADYENGRVIDRLEMFTQPDRQVIHELIGKLLTMSSFSEGLAIASVPRFSSYM